LNVDIRDMLLSHGSSFYSIAHFAANVKRFSNFQAKKEREYEYER